jgi:ketosteroid isomerase-like protein
MSQENVEVVRRIYANWVAGSSPVNSNLLHPDIDWVTPSYVVEPGTRSGIEAFTSITEGLDDTIRALRMDVERLTDAGDCVVVIATLRGQGSTSGVEVERRHGSIWTIRDGEAVRFQWCYEPEEALEAAGLREWPFRGNRAAEMSDGRGRDLLGRGASRTRGAMSLF